MNPEYYAVHFDMDGFDNEVWMALLSEWPFESFHEEPRRITGYIQKHDIQTSMLQYIDESKAVRFKDYQLEPVPDQNWNAVWESSFNPVAVDDFCYIRADFHASPAQPFRHEVIIAPRMAFGTGHHATTYMMLRAMASIDFKGKEVFDFGCGTGILAVVAAMEGAEHVTGIDIQPEALDNCHEHARLNQVVQKCTFLTGDIDLIEQDTTYDVILANINVTVIARYFERLRSMLRPGGYILLSGIMTYDRKYLEEHIHFAPLVFVSQQERQEWIQLTYKN